MVSETRTQPLSIPSDPGELLALVTSLVARIDRLEGEVQGLRTENATLRA